jgi:hypothetical protein
MKKLITVALAVSIAVFFAACGSSPEPEAGPAAIGGAAEMNGRSVPGMFPDFVKKALINAPKDSLVGIGTAKLASLSQSMTIAETRARAQIGRQISSMMRDMVTDFAQSSEVDPDSAVGFQEVITQSVSKSNMTGASVTDMDQTPDGTVWCVVTMNKENIGKEVKQEVAAAKLAVPKMQAFKAVDRLDAAIAKENAKAIEVAAE